MLLRAQSFLILFLGAGATVLAAANPVEPLRFNRDIRPILSDNCFVCHGRDKSTRKAEMRLDQPELAFAKRDNGIPIVPGKPDESLLMKRVTNPDPDEVMPPTKTSKKLSANQIDLLRRWIAEGAKYEPHWAFLLPVRPGLPPVANKSWVLNPIDQFILSKLEQEGLTPSEPADQRTLIRRVTFDLTGLPPAPAEVEAFVRSRDPLAYEKLVKRLLASPHFGERMALHWLDLVRYADTVGFHGDNPISVWPYRDYVIQAFNENMRFDQFTREQLAGDLLPNATRQQKVASAYNRLNRMSAEGGVQDKEYLAKYAADRVRTTASVWLGATMACAECHDHKYDPYTTKDFYRFEAFFADLKEKGFYDGGFGNGDWGPKLSLPNPEQEKAQARLNEQLAFARTNLAHFADADLAAARQEWEASVLQADTDKKLGWRTPAILSAQTANGAVLRVESNGVVHAEGPNPDQEVYSVTLQPGAGEFTALRLVTYSEENLPGNRIGRGGTTFVLTEVEVLARTGTSDQALRMAEATANINHPTMPIQSTFDGKANLGWGEPYGHSGSLEASLVFAEPLRAASNTVVTVRLRHESPVRRATIGIFKLALSAMPHPTHHAQGLPDDVLKALREPADKRKPEQEKLIAQHYRRIAPALAPARRELAALELEQARLLQAVPTVLVAEATKPRTIRVLPRGDWMNDTGEVVLPGVPEFLRHSASTNRATRLDLAEWLVAPDNPLTARAVMNRFWKLFYGAGISRSLEDLGGQGEWPTHPELLDWLAVEFRESGWDIKHVIELLVTSATYRQASHGNPKAEEHDPQNRLLARQNRFRLEAEFVRDNALAIAGLLNPQVGGRSVFPFQPDGYWTPLNFPKREYVTDNGDQLYRRGVYMHWQRTFTHPSLVAFDAPGREECTAARPVSNTPLQALVLLNDPNFVEAARHFAEAVLRRGGRKTDQRIAWAVQQALGRPVQETERRLLQGLYADQLMRYANDISAARALAGAGEKPIPADLNPAELAAWTAVTRTLLNLHETITRN